MAEVGKNESAYLLDRDTLRQLTQSLGVGVALVELEGWEVVFENANFFKWFPPESDADDPLTARLIGFKRIALSPVYKRDAPIAMKQKRRQADAALPSPWKFGHYPINLLI